MIVRPLFSLPWVRTLAPPEFQEPNLDSYPWCGKSWGWKKFLDTWNSGGGLKYASTVKFHTKFYEKVPTYLANKEEIFRNRFFEINIAFLPNPRISLRIPPPFETRIFLGDSGCLLLKENQYKSKYLRIPPFDDRKVGQKGEVSLVLSWDTYFSRL